MPFDSGQFQSGLGGILGGLFGRSGKPYDKAAEQYEKYGRMGQNTLQPFYNAGTGAVNNYQDWLNSQKNPTDFINKIMGDYKASPYSQYLQQQSLNATNNAGSASGLTGSSALQLQQQQNAGNIASQDMNQWLQNVLGINTQYGQGENNLVNTGQNSANALTQLFNNLGGRMGETAYGKEAGKQNDFWNTIGGGLNAIGSFFL